MGEERACEEECLIQTETLNSGQPEVNMHLSHSCWCLTHPFTTGQSQMQPTVQGA